MHRSLETGQSCEPLLSGRMLDGVLDLVGRHGTYAHERVLEVGANLRKRFFSNLRIEETYNDTHFDAIIIAIIARNISLFHHGIGNVEVTDNKCQSNVKPSLTNSLMNV